MHFAVSGVDCPIWLPSLLAFVVALMTAPAGLSGAFLLLPFQMSVLGYVSPGVTPTNLIYNVVAIPGGVYRYISEGRMVWPLTWTLAAGTLPGVVAGAFIRVRYLPDPRAIKLFVAIVLLILAVRLVRDTVRGRHGRFALQFPPNTMVRTTHISAAHIDYDFLGRTFSFRPAVLFLLALGVGVVGGIYGVGGGALIAPFLVSVLDLPAYTVAAASLFATLLTSIAGIVAFTAMAVHPDWTLGILFGLGGLCGSYLGARLQKHLPEQWIRGALALLAGALAIPYIRQFFR